MTETKPPLWQQVRDEMARDIRSGKVYPGELLPTEKALSERLGVHRHTVRRALQELREQGLVRTEQGRGTVVLEQPFEYKMGRRTRFSENMSLNRLKARSHFLYGDVITASELVAGQLELRPRSRVSYIEMYGEAEGKRVFVASQYIPHVDMEDLIAVFRKTGSLTKAYRHYGIKDYFRKVSRITTRLSNPEETRLLKLKQKQPLLVVEYVNVDPSGRPIEFGITRFSGDRMEIVVEGN
ncbi:phosphonate metabolism transcriptional regulator PhnF [Pseudodesulfovibrio sp.]|uniref:phosphonate metabolism transcriptional regulator PhnF n=1 Tax=Pseudodesulfovibrio sp. TaxID=2035812 RepID=UPI0026335520|nr:phosphonate metabolism transcriptional regulator PhnF [Pseudodesulfovibrio sp.]MDD3313572.1 phosphonate metabolism transcriptional regulator PhnF [Pseudodesulfovibrio sp.]